MKKSDWTTSMAIALKFTQGSSSFEIINSLKFLAHSLLTDTLTTATLFSS
ncbi:MAG: hypothetical protein N2235_22310 [Fischerella sp.]|nr:hypothetical protein [Fischerella sp.]